MADTINTIPFYISNESGSILNQIWMGHYTSKDSKSGVSSTQFFREKLTPSSASLIKLGEIYIISSSSDYWSLFFTIQDDDNLYGYSGSNANPWYSDEASIKYTGVTLRIPSGKANGILLGTTDGTSYTQFGSSFKISTLTAV